MRFVRLIEKFKHTNLILYLKQRDTLSPMRPKEHTLNEEKGSL